MQRRRFELRPWILPQRQGKDFTSENINEAARKVLNIQKKYAEHPFGHFKRNLGAGYFLLRGLDGVRAEMSLLANCFNVSRLITLLGVEGLIRELEQI